MMPVRPILLPMPFAQNGTRNEIPAESPGASAPNASWSGGFPPITMFNRQAGGLPPLGQDFNGILNALSQQAFWRQSGGMAEWSADLDYPMPALVVGSDGKYYTSLQTSGPSGTGAKDPTDAENGAYWAQAVLDGTAAVFTPPADSEPGKKGLVPAPGAMSDASKNYLGADAQWHSLPSVYNTREVLTASGTWTAPVDGWYKITAIGGGGGGGRSGQGAWSFSGSGGGSGGWGIGHLFLKKNQQVPYTIGAGGKGAVVSSGSKATAGGDTTFLTIVGGGGEGGDVALYTGGGKGGSGTIVGWPGGMGESQWVTSGTTWVKPGAGGGPGGGVVGKGTWYGAGGAGGHRVNTPQDWPGADGASGAVIIEYFDPNKKAGDE